MAETAQEVVDAAPAGRAILDLSALERIGAGLTALTIEGQQLLEKADPSSKDGDKALRTFRKRCVDVRVAAQRVYDEQNKPVLDLQRKMRRLRDDIEASVGKIEGPVDRIILAEEQRKEAARRAEAEREQRRIADMRQRIAGIAAMVVAMIGKASDEIEEQIALVTTIEIGPEWAEFEGEARAEQQASLDKLRAMRQTAVEQAEHDRQLRAERDAAERKLHYQRLIGALRESSFRFTMSTPAATLEDAISTLEATALSIDDWAEFLADAEQARDAALAELRTLLDTAKRIAEMDRVAAEQRKRQAELDEAAAALTQREQAQQDAQESALKSGTPDSCAETVVEAAQTTAVGDEGQAAHADERAAEPVAAFTLAEPERKFSTGAVGTWLGFTLTSAFIEQTLGVPGEHGVGAKSARLWTRVQLGQIRDALIKHLRTLRWPL